ncbi:hypothetical protein [Caballeronia sp. dw_276]|uniref:hypothetical protein n=1 Tax=Caballeronia sp. dw_276 TaxID=2719795 RepID=UPI001BD2EAEF|nr:hypothetical protein [Caballeronia sp. dw_276]
MRWMIDNPSRVARIVDARGHVQLTRDKATLQAEILDALIMGHQPKTALARALQTSKGLIDAALAELARQGKIENFRMMSERKRMDVFWCICGKAPEAKPSSYGFRAAETLAAFQAAAQRAAKP